MNVLLIYPPFGETDIVHLAVPLLAGYLRSNGDTVSVLDANIEFHRWLLTSDRIEHGKEFAEARAAELNGKRRLQGSERKEYLFLKKGLDSIKNVPKLMQGSWEDMLLDHSRIDGWVSATKRSLALSFARQIACAPYYPERFLNSGLGVVLFGSPHRVCSSRQIIESVNAPGLLDGFFEKQLEPIIKEKKTSVIGISVSFDSQVLSAFRCASVIKKLAPQTHIVMGGSWISTILREADISRFFGLVDSFIIDEGEVPLEKLVRELEKPVPDFSRVPGLMYLSDGKIVRNPSQSPYDMETFPPPDYTLFPLDQYFQPKKHLWLSLRTSKGCYWRRCAFCPSHRPVIANHQQASAEYAFKNLQAVIAQTGASNVGFIEEASKPEVLDALSRKIIDAKMMIHWATNVKLLYDITLESCMLWHEAGCYRLNFGLETYNDRILKFMRKGITVKMIDFALSNISWAGISSLAYMMVGLPSETEEEALQTFRDLMAMRKERLIASFSYSSYELIPGSEIYNHPGKYGIRFIPNTNPDDDLLNRYIAFDGTPIHPDRAGVMADMFNELKSPRRQAVAKRPCVVHT